MPEKEGKPLVPRPLSRGPHFVLTFYLLMTSIMILVYVAGHDLKANGPRIGTLAPIINPRTRGQGGSPALQDSPGLGGCRKPRKTPKNLENRRFSTPPPKTQIWPKKPAEST